MMENGASKTLSGLISDLIHLADMAVAVEQMYHHTIAEALDPLDRIDREGPFTVHFSDYEGASQVNSTIQSFLLRLSRDMERVYCRLGDVQDSVKRMERPTGQPSTAPGMTLDDVLVALTGLKERHGGNTIFQVGDCRDGSRNVTFQFMPDGGNDDEPIVYMTAR